MTHASLFSGIGGFDLAAKWMGWENIFQVEIDKFCQKVLTKNFPNVTRYGDIKQFDGTQYAGAIDVLTGGFPCQPFSVAGKRKGTEDDRFLWHEMLRIISEVQPAWIIAENVSGIITQGEGLVFEQVCSEMEKEGYEVQPFIIPACATNAPHRRDRVWFVAYSNGNGNDTAKGSEKGFWKHENKEQSGNRGAMQINGLDDERAFAYTGSNGIQQNNATALFHKERNYKEYSIIESNITGGIKAANEHPNWQTWPTQSPVSGRDDGLPNRVDRIKSLGNAIVPQVAFEIFKAIEHSQTKLQLT